jgi:MoaA/NifB/PqqE/SkfB family radical SAM enzyme
MYNLSDIKIIHLEPTSKCQARCPQCGRFEFSDDGKINKINPLITDRNGKTGCLDQIDFADFVKWFPPEFISQLDYLYMCGTSGEPTLANDCLKILAYLRTRNPKMHLSVHTNGGCKPKEWWEKLAKLRVKAIFGIDGLEDTHSLYRVNTNWRKIIENARAFIDAGGDAEWQMLVFKHNEHQVLKCMKLAKMLGFKAFHCQHTTRFSENGDQRQAVYNPNGEITHYLEPSLVSLQNYEKVKSSFYDVDPPKETIDCFVKRQKELYIAANGDVLPCCHMQAYTHDEISDYNRKLNIRPNLHKNTLKEIFDSLYFRKIQSTWNNNPLLTCAKVCGKTTGTWQENTTSQSKFITF